jgi:hypothetical protein
MGPGIGDNSLAIAAAVWLAERHQNRDLAFAFTTAEEGGGSLAGARRVAALVQPATVLVFGRTRSRPPGPRFARATTNAPPRAQTWRQFGKRTPGSSAAHVMIGATAWLLEMSGSDHMNIGALWTGARSRPPRDLWCLRTGAAHADFGPPRPGDAPD